MQEDFESGKLSAGLYREGVAQKTFVNNVSGLRQKLELFRKDLDWLERMDITCSEKPEEGTVVDGDEVTEGVTSDVNVIDSSDDFKREMSFYNQALECTLAGLKKLKGLEVPVSRPEDYFAEMVKTDEHMQRIRKRLMTEEETVVRSEKARKLREVRKYGKKVQQEILEKRQKEKTKALEAVKKFRKGKGAKPDFLRNKDDVEDSAVGGQFDVAVDHDQSNQEHKLNKVKSKKRQNKDARFGFGGKKRGLKRNTSASSADMSFFDTKINNKPPKKKMKVATRPGKSKRMKIKQRKRRH